MPPTNGHRSGHCRYRLGNGQSPAAHVVAMEAAVEFRILGPLELVEEGRPIDVRRPATGAPRSPAPARKRGRLA